MHHPSSGGILFAIGQEYLPWFPAYGKPVIDGPWPGCLRAGRGLGALNQAFHLYQQFAPADVSFHAGDGNAGWQAFFEGFPYGFVIAGVADVDFQHGKAGEAAAERLGLHIIATDLIERLPAVMKKFDQVVD